MGEEPLGKNVVIYCLSLLCANLFITVLVHCLSFMPEIYNFSSLSPLLIALINGVKNI